MEDGLTLDTWVARRIGCEGPLTADAVREHQQKKMWETFETAFSNSPFHKSRGLGSINQWTDIPFTTPHDLRAYGLQMLCKSQGEIDRVVTLETSGTSGPPKRLYFTHEDQDHTVEFFRAGMASFTEPGEQVLILLPGERPGSIGTLLFSALERMGAAPIAHGLVRNISKVHEELVRAQTPVLVGTPLQVLGLARYSEQIGQTENVAVCRALLSTDYVSKAVVRELGRIWGCEIYRYYGMTEAGLGWGIECACHSGYHLYEADFVTEIVDPETGQPVPDGKVGEVVLTTLNRKGMPLIRYRTGDLSRFIPEPCGCGSVLKRLDAIQARVDGAMKLKTGATVTIGQLDECLLDMPGILNFHPVFIPSTGCDTLSIRADFLYACPEQEYLYERLSRIPAIREAHESQKLHIEATCSVCDGNFAPPAGKRKIEILPPNTIR